MPERKLVASWQNWTGRYWLNLYEFEFEGTPAYEFSADNGRGNLERMSRARAIATMEEKVRGYALCDNIRMERIELDDDGRRVTAPNKSEPAGRQI